uniref:Soluble ligand binding domain-containing protein n=1 Tax=candidate division WWE3 bacterium TaxID=2053526 RepID=A0A7C4XNG6_UNCKA
MFEDLKHYAASFAWRSYIQAIIKGKIWILVLTAVSVVGVVFYLVNLDSQKENSQEVVADGRLPIAEVSEPKAAGDIKVFCDVSGAVVNPGVYELKSNPRVIDALKSAGGLSKESDFSWIAVNLNLSKLLEDECKVYIPFVWDTYSSNNVKPSSIVEFHDSIQQDISVNDEDNNLESRASNSAVSNKVNLNSGTEEELKELKGIGDVYARRIVENRPYKDFEDFATKTKFSTSLLNSLKDLVSF